MPSMYFQHTAGVEIYFIKKTMNMLKSFMSNVCEDILEDSSVTGICKNSVVISIGENNFLPFDKDLIISSKGVVQRYCSRVHSSTVICTKANITIIF